MELDIATVSSILTILGVLVGMFLKLNGSIDKKISSAFTAYDQKQAELREVEDKDEVKLKAVEEKLLESKLINLEGKMKSIAKTNALMAGQYKTLHETQTFVRKEENGEEE